MAPVFNQSSLLWADAQARVADVVGASADPPMLVRAERALRQAQQKWNNYHPWSWLTATCTASANASGMFALPSDFRTLYDIIWQGDPRRLYYLEPRLYDQLRPNNEGGTPTHYSLFSVGATGMLSLYPPISGGSLSLRYWRRMNYGSVASASGALDLPEDFESAFLALAKYYFLVDKGGDPERVASWKEEGFGGMNQARSMEQHQPDQVSTLLPGYLADSPGWNPNSTVGL